MKFSLVIIMSLNWIVLLGQTWSSLPNQTDFGSPNYDVAVHCLEVWEGQLVLAGGIDSISGVDSQGIALFDGSNFYPLGHVGGTIKSMAVYDEDLIILNHISVIGVDSSASVARWDGENWFGMGVDESEIIEDAIVFNEILFVAGEFTEFGNADDLSGMASWNGEQWLNVGGCIGGDVLALETFNDSLLLGGYFSQGSLGDPMPGLAAYDEDLETVPFHGGMSGTLYDMITDPVSGNLVLAGNFSNYVTEDLLMYPARWVCQWDGQEWSKLGIDTLSTHPLTIEVYRDQIYAGGHFKHVYKPNGDTLLVNHIARFDGIEWQALDEGIDWNVLDMEVYNDELYVVSPTLDTIVGSGEAVNGIAKWYMHPDSVTWGVSVPEIALEKRKILNAFPNPNDGQFSVELRERVNGLLILTDLNGRQLRRLEIANELRVEFELDDLPKGMYLVNLVQGGVVKENVRVVVEN